jgi:hypothetical protein
LARRLERLERDNLRLRVGLVLILLVGVALLVMG